MGKSSRKQVQRQTYEQTMQQQRQARWNPDLPEAELQQFHQTCDRMFQALEAVSRPASVLANPQRNQSTPKSHIGGAMLMAAGESWPDEAGEPLAAAMEIYLDELPAPLPEPLRGISVLQIFLEIEPGEFGPEYGGGSWQVRCLSSTEGCTPKSQGFAIASLPVAWEPLEHDIPSYPDDIDLIPTDIRQAFEQLPNWSQLLRDRFPSGPATRIGGWPQWIQGSELDDTFCLQISGQDIGIEMGPEGALYFSFDEMLQGWNCLWEIG